MIRVLNFLVLTLVTLLGISFAILNADIVAIRYYLGTQRMPLSLLILIVLAFGIIIGVLASVPVVLRLKMEIRRLYRDRG